MKHVLYIFYKVSKEKEPNLKKGKTSLPKYFIHEWIGVEYEMSHDNVILKPNRMSDELCWSNYTIFA